MSLKIVNRDGDVMVLEDADEIRQQMDLRIDLPGLDLSDASIENVLSKSCGERLVLRNKGITLKIKLVDENSVVVKISADICVMTVRHNVTKEKMSELEDEIDRIIQVKRGLDEM